MAMLVFAALAGSREPQLRALGRLRAVALGLGLFSLSGIPPTPGFWAKLAVLVVAWQAAGPLPTLIAVAGGVFSVLYYLRPLPDLFAALRGDGRARRGRCWCRACSWPYWPWSGSACSRASIWTLARGG